MIPSLPVRRPRAVFVSDIHLGTRSCKAEFLLDFLRCHEPETLYLVGDIVDGWSLRRSWYWPSSHDEVLQEILRKVRRGVRVVYIPGNHDEVMRSWLGTYAGVEVVRETEHVTQDGLRLLVLHGDESDAIVRSWRWLAHVGDWGYQAATHLDHWMNHARRLVGRPYWSLAGHLKRNVKQALRFLDDYERHLAHQARERGFDGVVAGHVHHASRRTIDGTLYLNDGDWVDSCTALVEQQDGQFEIVEWIREREVLLHAGRAWTVALEPVDEAA